jgi:hypothetical protein
VTDKDRQLLAAIRRTWHFVGYSSPAGHRGERAPRATLRHLIALGFIEVRTVTISNWRSIPRIEDGRKGPYVEARLTDQGLDVRRAQRSG